MKRGWWCWIWLVYGSVCPAVADRAVIVGTGSPWAFRQLVIDRTTISADCICGQYGMSIWTFNDPLIKTDTIAIFWVTRDMLSHWVVSRVELLHVTIDKICDLFIDIGRVECDTWADFISENKLAIFYIVLCSWDTLMNHSKGLIRGRHKSDPSTNSLSKLLVSVNDQWRGLIIEAIAI